MSIWVQLKPFLKFLGLLDIVLLCVAQFFLYWAKIIHHILGKNFSNLNFYHVFLINLEIQMLKNITWIHDISVKIKKLAKNYLEYIHDLHNFIYIIGYTL